MDRGPNATTLGPVCLCFQYGGWETSCTDAQCTFGATTGCSTRSWTYYLNAIASSCTIVLVMGVLLYGLAIAHFQRKFCRRNVSTIVFIATLAAAVSHCLWQGAVFASTVVLSTEAPMLFVQKPVAIPMFTICQVRPV